MHRLYSHAFLGLLRLLSHYIVHPVLCAPVVLCRTNHESSARKPIASRSSQHMPPILLDNNTHHYLHRNNKLLGPFERLLRGCAFEDILIVVPCKTNLPVQGCFLLPMLLFRPKSGNNFHMSPHYIGLNARQIGLRMSSSTRTSDIALIT